MFKVFLLLMLFSFPLHAKDLVCNAFGHNVPIYKTNATELWNRYGTAEGVAWVDNNNNPIIVYDERLDLLPFVKNHVIAHECAHHKLGHVIGVLRGYSTNEDADEHAADCFASKMVAGKLWYGNNEFDAITGYIEQNIPNDTHRAHRITSCKP